MEDAETEQYRRHISLDGFGIEKQLKLKHSSVLVVGAGGLGCAALQYLVCAGVGHLGIIDDDIVEISNLQRQVIFSHDDQGKSKAEIAAAKLRRMNPFIKVQAYHERFSKQNCEFITKGYDLVIDGTDNFSSRYLINDTCVLLKKPLIHGSINEFEGMVSVFNFNEGPTYRCLFPEQLDPSSIPTCAQAGVLGVLPGIIGSWQALETIKVITGLGEPLSGKVLLYNALNHTTRTIRFNAMEENRLITKLPDPIISCNRTDINDPVKGSFKEISANDLHAMILGEKNFQVLDVREDWERQRNSIQPSFHEPLVNIITKSHQDLSLQLDPNKNLVIYCKAGVRSRMACQALESQGFKNLFNLSCGMDGWMQSFPDLTM